MLSNFNKTFYALVSGPAFGFDKKNFLKNSFNINFKYQVLNNVERNINGQLLQLKPREKFVINLSGNGSLCECNVGKELLFVSSVLKRPYQADQQRKVMFDYLFAEHDLPLKNMEGNINDLDDKKNLFFVPLIDVYITEKIVSMKKNIPTWELVLEEI